MRRFSVTWVAAMVALLCAAPLGFASGGSGGGGGTSGGGGTGGGGSTTPLPAFALTMTASPKTHSLSYGSSINFKTTVTNGTSTPLNVTLDYVVNALNLPPAYPSYYCNNGRAIEVQMTVSPGTVSSVSPVMAYQWCVADYAVTVVATDSITHAVLGTQSDTFSITPPTPGS